jgi:hypothetical protein
MTAMVVAANSSMAAVKVFSEAPLGSDDVVLDVQITNADGQFQEKARMHRDETGWRFMFPAGLVDRYLSKISRPIDRPGK